MGSIEKINNLLIGRSMLLRASTHLKAYTRVMNLTCALDEERADHIGNWIAAGKEDGFENSDDEYSELIDCPRCSARYAAFKARKLVLANAGKITGALTRIGNVERRNREEAHA